MAPSTLRYRQSLSKDKFTAYLEHARTQTYHDASSSGARGGLGSSSSSGNGVSGGGGSGSLRSIAWNPLGTLVATGSTDRTLRVWNPEKPSVRYSTDLKGHTAPIEQVAFNPVRDSQLASVSNDGALKIWDVRTKHCVHEIRGSSPAIPTGPAASSTPKLSTPLDTNGSRTPIGADGQPSQGLGDAFTLAWAPDGESLIVGNQANTVHVISLTGGSGTQPATVPSTTSSAPTTAGSLQIVASYPQPVQTNQIAFCWSGKKVFVTTGQGSTRILSYPSLEPLLLRSTGEDGPAKGHMLPEDEEHTNGHESAISKKEFVLYGHTSSCITAALQPTGAHLATGGSDSLICLWDTHDWICQRVLTRLVGPVRSLSFTFDGSYLVGGSEEGTGLEIYHTETGDHVYTAKTPGPCPIVAWAPNRYALAYSSLGTLRILSLDEHP